MFSYVMTAFLRMAATLGLLVVTVTNLNSVVRTIIYKAYPTLTSWQDLT